MFKSIAIFGDEASGKTTFINKMISDVKKFEPELVITEKADSSLAYAAGKRIISRSFTLSASQSTHWEFDLIDYSGNILSHRDSFPDEFSDLTTHFNNSCLWFVIINGAVFANKTKEIAIETMRQHIGQMLSYQLELYKNINDNIPELVFVVDNAQICSRVFSNSDVKEIIIESLKLLLPDINNCAMIYSENMRTKTAGLALLKSIFTAHSNDLFTKEDEVRQEITELNTSLAAKSNELQSELTKMEGKISIFRDEEKIQSLKQQLESIDADIQSNNTKLQNSNGLIEDIALKNLAIVINRIINYNKYAILNKLDKFDYPLELSMTEVPAQNEEKFQNIVGYIMGTLLLILIIIFLFCSDEPLTAIIGTIVYGAIIAFVPSTIAKAIAAICIIVVLFKALNVVGVIVLILFFILFGGLMTIGEKMDKDAMAKKPKEYRFTSDLVESIDKAAKEN